MLFSPATEKRGKGTNAEEEEGRKEESHSRAGGRVPPWTLEKVDKGCAGGGRVTVVGNEKEKGRKMDSRRMNRENDKEGERKVRLCENMHWIRD